MKEHFCAFLCPIGFGTRTCPDLLLSERIRHDPRDKRHLHGRPLETRPPRQQQIHLAAHVLGDRCSPARLGRRLDFEHRRRNLYRCHRHIVRSGEWRCQRKRNYFVGPFLQWRKSRWIPWLASFSHHGTQLRIDAPQAMEVVSQSLSKASEQPSGCPYTTPTVMLLGEIRQLGAWSHY